MTQTITPLEGGNALGPFRAQQLLTQLQASSAPLPRRLDADSARHADLPAVHHTEASFRYALNEDAMATEKLAEGIRGFAADAAKLDAIILAR